MAESRSPALGADVASRAIRRKIQHPPSMDYAFLREEGIRHIQKLSGLLWTDHNAHDPGITTLEILCYALTDLAYRARFETRDLMTAPDGRMDPADYSGLVPAHEVLPPAPLTPADYRRLLMHIDGVRNAWLDPMNNPDEADRLSEVPIHADHGADALTPAAVHPVTGQANPQVKVAGLYRVLVNLESPDDDMFGPLNDAAVTCRVRRGPMKGAILSLESSEIESWDGLHDLDHDLVEVNVVSVTPAPSGFTVAVTIRLSNTLTLDLKSCRVWVVEDRPRADRPPLEMTPDRLRDVLLGVKPDDVMGLFWAKQRRRSWVLGAISRVLHAHRGLCEDYLSIRTVLPRRVGICADIEVTADADLERVQAAVFHEIARYLSPPVRFHSLEELLARGIGPEEIFNSPMVDFGFTSKNKPVFTKPGFITDEDLAACELRRLVQASDIINLVLEIQGVEAVRNLQLLACDGDGRILEPAVRWTLRIPADHQPVFFIEGSKLLFHKAGMPYRAKNAEFERTLKLLQVTESRQALVPLEQRLPEPVGRWRHLDLFHSVQHDFPATYQIGPARIPGNAPSARVAQARQLKGYLAFFDQMLADYLGQLSGLRRLYSLDKGLTRTWFSQMMTGVAGSLEAFEDEFLVNKEDLADDGMRTSLSETEEAFLDRRNRLLDHLMARFAERFSDYALLSFGIDGDRLHSKAQAIAHKIDFLNQYPRLSRERGMGANQRPEVVARVWNSDNISGLERRVGRLLGISNPNRRYLQCRDHFARFFTFRQEGSAFRVVIQNDDDTPLFISNETFPNLVNAQKVARLIYEVFHKPGVFQVTSTPGSATFTLRLALGITALTHRDHFDTQMAASRTMRAIRDRHEALLLTNPSCDSEGMHLVEQILLRPLAADYQPLMGVCPNKGEGCGEEDPYSFRVSVVLPYWPVRFRNLHFRALLERTLREEAPAHVQVKVCWIGQQQMMAFESAFQSWLHVRAGARPDPDDVRRKTLQLIRVMESLTSVYPSATLHTCDADQHQISVRLGSTALGAF